jgi:predicted RNA-binding protein YlxR (DUF448 family)
MSPNIAMDKAGAMTEPLAAGANERTCIVSRRALPKHAMVRFVIAPNGSVVPDIAERLPGRGLWVSAAREAVVTASTRGHFAKAARRAVSADPGLADEVERQLAARALSLLGFARRAGAIAFGHDRVREMIESGRVGLLIEASDASPGSRARMTARADDVPQVALFSRAELGAPLGRDEIVHVALEAGPLAERFHAAARRLDDYRRSAGASDVAPDADNG